MKGLEKLLIVTSLGTTLGALGFFIYTLFIFERPLLSDKKERERMIEEVEKRINFETFQLEKMTTNLFSESRGRLRYINLEMHLQPFREKQLYEIKEKEFIIYDTIIQVASESDPEKLNSLAGKILFEKFIKDKINSQLETPLIKKIFFTTFIIQ